MYDNNAIRKLGKHKGVLIYHDPNLDVGFISVCQGQKYTDSSYLGMATCTDGKITIIDGDPKLYTEQERTNRTTYQIMIVNNKDFEQATTIADSLFALPSKTESPARVSEFSEG
jgi:hypothetical protein